MSISSRNIILLFIILTINLYGNNVEVEFKYPLSDEISYNKAKEIALVKAKEEALRKAGIGENIQSFTTLFETSKDGEYNKKFYQDAFSTIKGYIESWEYTSPPKKIYEGQLTYIHLAIKAKVKKYESKRDLKFMARISGLKAIYESNNEGEYKKNIHLSINPTKDAYLKVFYFNDNEAKILYPIEVSQGVESNEVIENSIILEGNTKEINYFSPYTEKEEEKVTLIFVLTKEDYPYKFSQKDEDGFFTNTDIDKVFEWITSIELSEKFVEIRSFTIIK